SFVDACEAQRPPQQRREAHHAPGPKARLARRGRSENPAEAGVAADFFLAVCAEAVAKLHAGPSVSLRSRQAVREFFCRLVPEPHRELLGEGFRTYRHYPLGTSAVADVLYEVRCSVAHEGSYWDFALHDGDTAMLSNDSE